MEILPKIVVQDSTRRAPQPSARDTQEVSLFHTEN